MNTFEAPRQQALEPGKEGVARTFRIALPLCAAGALGLLLFAQLVPGARTEVSGQAPLGLLEPHTASEDNLITAAQRLWEAQAWVSVAIVVGLSGIWPHLKLIATVAIVSCTNSMAMRKSSATRALMLLEVLGKYSFADVFMICFNYVTFNITTNGTYRVALLFSLEVNLYMELHFPAVALIVAITVSAFLTHWSIHEIRRDQELLPLLNEEAPIVASSSATALGPSGISRALLPATSGIALLVLGSFLPLVTIERAGFLGQLIRPEEQQTLHLSVVAISSSMLHTPQDLGGNLWAMIMVVFFVFLVFIAPLVELLALVAAALCSEEKGQDTRKRAIVAAEWLHSFDCVDVLLIVAAAFVMELHTVVDFNIGSECDPFKSIMNNTALLRLAGLEFAASPVCFDPRPRFNWGWPVMLAVVIARTVAWRAVSRSCLQS